eukprot:TRINITY_DN27142_c0_g1_i1.p1 TRINITY_DN27142_c0_g1~~TRINITY_DN27142_c0_g1_i1.p1  ORF type:complete len:324 (+),score=124.27 TRINITY_DN27142_c0_g1_i1:58-1029(+)
MPPARWSCAECGLVNKASNTVCSGCGTKAMSLDTGQWDCPGCGKAGLTTPTCSHCNYRKPLKKDGIPQIFEGMRCVFTGIIPRSIPHWSEWKEWQEAEQRGARPLNEISSEMTHLIYKEGFERSDKVRKAQKQGNVKCVCSEWYYQCISLGVKLDEDPYLINLPQKKLVAASVQNATKDIVASYTEQLAAINATLDAVTKAGTADLEPVRVSIALMEDGNFHWMGKPKEARPLFQDCMIAYSDAVPTSHRDLVSAYAGKLTTNLKDATHLVIAPEDEGSKVVAEGVKAGVSVASLLWVEHCIQLLELIPAMGPYDVGAKLTTR